MSGRRWFHLIVGALFIVGCSGRTTAEEEGRDPPPTTTPEPTVPTTTPEPTVPTTTPEPTVPITAPERTDPAAEPSTALVIQPDDDVAGIVAAAPPGMHFRFAEGIHRAVSVTAREGDVFSGQPGAVVSGAVVVEGFVAGDGWWRASVDDTPDEPHGQCGSATPLCGLPEELFVDGEPLSRVAGPEAVGPTSWWFDPDGPAVVIGLDPQSHEIELSVAPWAIRGSVSGVVVRDLRFENYANIAGDGVIHLDESGSSWTVEDCEITDSHGVGIVVRDGSVVRGCRVESIGQQGIGAGGADVLVERNSLSENNRLGFDPAWSAGGAKFAFTERLVVRDNDVYDNDGAGLWTDLDCVDTLYEGNRVRNNTGAGIFHEISYRAEIRDNIVIGNGSDSPGWIWGAGIQVAGSSDVTVVGNLVVGNHHGIAGVDQDRGEGLFGEYRLRNLTVIENVVRNSGQVGIAQDHEDAEVYERGHVFDRNTYEGEMSWAWTDWVRSFEEWQAFGNDSEGSHRPD
jgi:parallel beta-helix repeat protein